MAGKGNASALGPNAEIDYIDGGTSALMSTPAPGSVGTTSATMASVPTQTADAPMSGGIPYAIGQPSVVRIPIPGTGGLAIELTARGWTPKGGSTSTLFFQDPTGARQLRLDYGYNDRTKTIDYHWN